jgi:hypothetical protein
MLEGGGLEELTLKPTAGSAVEVEDWISIFETKFRVAKCAPILQCECLTCPFVELWRA